MSRPIPGSEERPRSRAVSNSLQQASLRLAESPRSRGSPGNATPIESYRRNAAILSASPRKVVRGFSVEENVTTEVDPAVVIGTPRSNAIPGLEDPAVVDRHLDPQHEEDAFASLQLQGGDVHRQVYQWSQQQKTLAARRSQSFYLPRPTDTDESARNMRVPGGFRRNYLATQRQDEPGVHRAYGAAEEQIQPRFLTRNFIEFLSLYGHFAGEDLEDDDDDDDEDVGVGDDSSHFADTEPEDTEPVRRPLLGPRKSTRRKTGIRMDERGEASVTKAVLLLLKSFVGTGVLFLPKAFLNGGMLFSSLVLLGVSAISLWCFLLLVNTRLVVNASFGDIGGHLYGKHMRTAILVSIVISQIGFVCAYMAFTAENLGAFVYAVTDGQERWSMMALIGLQLTLFLPLSMIRDIGKLSFTALIADAFILLGLLYLYYADIYHIVDRGISDIVLFNERDWTLFIGTAIFTFEGIGLIIPITQAMRQPEKFPAALGGVMLFITILFTSIGALSYAAFGSRTQTVILSNLPQGNRFVNSVQLLYSLAILLSTPLQLFPAIRILETAIFTKSGKFSRKTKWTKNAFRVLLVLCSALVALLGADDLDKFVSLIGSFACVPLVFVYPPLLHLKACSRTPVARTADVALACFGGLAMVYTTVTSIQSWISS
ncbi:hypothetical protein PYCC9005_002726 [Savitreella phatthalungensis]